MHSLTTPEPGDNIGVLIKGITRKQAKRGMMLAKVGSVKLNNRVKAKVFLLGSEEGGIDEPVCVDHTFMIYSKTFNITANVNAILGVDDQCQLVMPGEETEMELMIVRKMYFPVGSRFTMRTKSLTVGFGVGTSVYFFRSLLEESMVMIISPFLLRLSFSDGNSRQRR